jgi:hypothetical protein
MNKLSGILHTRKGTVRIKGGDGSQNTTPTSPTSPTTVGSSSETTSPVSLLEVEHTYGECLSPFNIHHINLKEQKSASEKEERDKKLNGHTRGASVSTPSTRSQTVVLNIPKEETTMVFGNDERVINTILSFVTYDAKTLCSLIFVNKKWNAITDSEPNWKIALDILSNGKPGQEESTSSKDQVRKLILASKQTTPTRRVKEPKKLDPLDPAPFYATDYKTIVYKEDPEENIIWVEEENGKKVIDASTLNKLIEEMTSHVNYDAHFLHTFILTYRSFTNAHQLLDLLITRFNIPPPENCTHEEFAEFKAEKLDKVRLRVISAIKYWLENFYVFDFENDAELRKKVDNFINIIQRSNGQALSTMLSRTLDRVTSSDSGVIQSKLKCPPILTIKRTMFNKNKKFGVMDYPLQEVARQMTLIDFEHFAKIEPKECLNQSWNKEHRTTKAPNLNNMIQHFNRVSGWVGTEIVQCEDLEKRAKKMASFVELASMLEELNNYNGVFSVMSGLALAAIHRLKNTYNAMPEETRAEAAKLSQFLSRDLNFKFLRTKIKQQKPPLVPYVGLYLTDLTFIEEGSPKYLERNDLKLINFDKCRKFASVIRDIQTYQYQRYPLEPYPELKDLLMNLEVMPEEKMYEMSLVREERVRSKKAPKKQAEKD